MKIKPKDFEILKKAMFKVLDDNPNIEEEYKKKGLSDKRFRWDILWRTKLKIGRSPMNPGDVNIYDYANDDHIDTALKAIIMQYKKQHKAKTYSGLHPKILKALAKEMERSDFNNREGDKFYDGFSAQYKQLLRRFYSQNIHYVISRSFPATRDFNEYLLQLTYVLRVVSERPQVTANTLVRALRFAQPQYKQFQPWYDNAVSRVLKFVDDVQDTRDKLTQ